MSTKTTFKRVALVAVAALGLGVLSVAPSSAVVNSDTLVVSSATAAQTTAETATATSATTTLAFLAGATNDSMSVTASLVSGPSTGTALPYLRLVETSSAIVETTSAGLAVSAGYSIAPNTAARVSNTAATAARVSAKFQVFLGTDSYTAPTVAGTYVVRLTPALSHTTTGSLNSTAQTITITVTTAATQDKIVSAGLSTVRLTAGETTTPSVASTDDKVTKIKTASSTSTQAANIKITQLNAAGAAASESITAIVTGVGTINSGAEAATAGVVDALTTPKVRALTVKAGDIIQLWADGASGVQTVTLTSASGVALGTKSVTYYGDVTAISAKTAALTTGTIAKVGTTNKLISFAPTDASGTAIGNTGSYYLVSNGPTIVSNTYTACAWDAVDGWTCNVTGVAKGTTSVYVTNKPSATDTTVTTVVKSADVSVRVGTTTPASVKVALDKSSYAPGEKATLTVSLFDADGNAVPSETYTGIFATGGIVSSYALSTSSDVITGTGTGTIAIDGVQTYEIYMPVTEGDVTFKWTTGSTAAAATAGLATANQKVAGIITVAVGSAASAAAIDAANEATDAANAATDAALAAADAADAATAAAEDASAAVAKLAKSVNTQLKALKKQLTSLIALVNKLR
jgi:hypothetical protein